MKTIMNPYLKRVMLLMAVWIAPHSVLAEGLPNEAKREIDSLKKFVKEREVATEKRIIRRKRDAVRALERYEKSFKHEFGKNLIRLQLVKYRKQIAESEQKIRKKSEQKNNDENEANNRDSRRASNIVDFNKSYYYNHPMPKYKSQIGELRFMKNGVVNCTHRTGKKIEMEKKWRWQIKGSKLVIKADHVHGPIYVSKKSPREIYLDWKGIVNKKNVAKQN